YFEQDPNAARFRDLARTLLAEPGSTKESVRETIKEYGVDDTVLDRIFHTSQRPQLQQQAQANAGESGNRENEIRERALKLAEIRGKGNKGTQFLRDLKKENFTPEEISRIDAAAGDPVAKRTRGNQKPK